jgi:cell division protein FtsZ
MRDTGSALMGIGRGTGENRAVEAAKAAISSPLLELSIDGANGILCTIVGGPDLGIHEINEAAKIITQSADPAAKIIFGAVINEDMKDEVKITVTATGFSTGAGSERRQTIEPVAVREPIYTPNEFIENQNRVVPQPTPISRVPKRPIARKITPIEPQPAAGDDELDIPAFIRKKMK